MELSNDFRVGVPVEQAWALLTDVERIAPCLPGAQLKEIEGDVYRGLVKVKVGPITAQYKGQATFVERDDDAHRAVLRAEGRETRGQGNANATVTLALRPDGDGTAASVTTDLTVTGRVAQFGRGVLADVSSKLIAQFVESLEREVIAGDGAGAGAASTGAGVEEPGPLADSAAIVAGGPESAPAVTGTGGPEDAPTEVAPTVAAAASPTSSGATAGAGSAATATDARPAVRRIDSPEPEPVDLLGTAGSPLARRIGPIVAAVGALWLLRRLLRRR